MVGQMLRHYLSMKKSSGKNGPNNFDWEKMSACWNVSWFYEGITEQCFIKNYHWKEMRCFHCGAKQISRPAFQTLASPRHEKAHMTKLQMISGVFSTLNLFHKAKHLTRLCSSIYMGKWRCAQNKASSFVRQLVPPYWQHLSSLNAVSQEVCGKKISIIGLEQDSYSLGLASIDFWPFPELKSTMKEILGHQWHSEKCSGSVEGCSKRGIL